MENKYTPCGGCGATEPIQRCIGCFHPFAPVNRFCHIEWVNLATHFTEDWEIMHCRYASDGYKLDTDLFELKDGGLVKKGGTGRLELKEVEYMVELGATAYAATAYQAQQENESLKRWKDEATTLLNPILDYGQSKEANIPLGESITDTVLERCKRYDIARTLLEKAMRWEGAIMGETENDLMTFTEIKTFLDGEK